MCSGVSATACSPMWGSGEFMLVLKYPGVCMFGAGFGGQGSRFSVLGFGRLGLAFVGSIDMGVEVRIEGQGLGFRVQGSGSSGVIRPLPTDGSLDLRIGWGSVVKRKRHL